MKNYICINGQRIELTGDQVARICAAQGQWGVKLADVPVGEVRKIGDHEIVVLEHSGDTTAVICKDLLPGDVRFGSTNNFAGSNVESVCAEFAAVIATIVGEKNLIEHTVDLTSDDGLKDYGKVKSRCSLLTADRYRRYVDILDKHMPARWWWLATPHSTKRHGNDEWVKCVSPSGRICNDICRNGDIGVRPFLILKSNIFVSK